MLNSFTKGIKFTTWLLLIVSFSAYSTAQSNTLESKTVQLAVVNTPHDSGLLNYLLKDFEIESGINVDIYSGSDVYQRARNGKADIVISHYGKAGLSEFVLDELGSWPKMVFSNQAALIGPTDDPANVSSTSSIAVALELIAASGNILIANNNEGLMAIIETAQINPKDHSAWFKDTGLAKGQAIKAAERDKAYVLWGAIPFLKFKQKHNSSLTLLLTEDPSLQRIMAITRVNPEHFSDINSEAAKRLEDYLLSHQTQAKIKTFRVEGYEGQLWWPAARHN